MIEGAEEFGPELQLLRFRQAEFFSQRQVPVVPTRSVEEAPAGIPKLPNGLIREQRGVEVRIRPGGRIAFAGIGDVQGAREAVWFVHGVALACTESP